jgi:hypothetical protein
MADSNNIINSSIMERTVHRHAMALRIKFTA